ALDQDGNPIPNLATSSVIDTSGQNWTYTIRSGVKWHDGTNLTPKDVAFSVNYQAGTGLLLWAYEPYFNRILPCGSAPFNDSIEGGPDCGANITDWNTPSPNQVTIHFDMPFVPGKSLYFPIVQWKQWCDSDTLGNCTIAPDIAQTAEENLNPIGTGPFKADANIGTEWRAAKPLLLHKNPNYHMYTVQIDDMFLVPGFNDATLVQAIRNSEIDVAEVTPGGYDFLGGISGIGRQEHLMSTQYEVELGFQQVNDETVANVNLNPARWDQNVRRALAMATNKDAILRTDFGGKGVRGASLISPISPLWHYDPSSDPAVNLTFNVSAANALLDAAGYTDTCPGKPAFRAAASAIDVDANGQPGIVPQGTCLSFVLGVRQEYSREQAAARDIVTMWSQVGVDVTNTFGTTGTFSVMFESALYDAVYTDWTLDAYIWYWSGDPDPNYLLSIESGYTLDGWNDNYWDNATYNALYLDHLSAFVPSERQQIVRDALKVHYESAVYIILVYPFGEWAYRDDKFEGWGDWSAHPYRQLNSFFTAPPLFADLKPRAAQSEVDIRIVGAGIGIALVAVVAVLVWFSRRTRRQREPPMPPPTQPPP
ncbi:MAG: ABC transporter substrate-binding protein, partial [Thermoplasmata archaeon]